MTISRRARLTWLGLTTVALALVAWYAVQSVVELKQIRTQVAVNRAELIQLKSQLPAIQQREAFAQEAKALQEQVKRLGLSASDWSNRRVQQTTKVVSRGDAEKLLGQQLGRNGQDWFVPERFDVGVVNPADGLFTPVPLDDKGFTVEIAGPVYFPLAVK